MTSWWTPSDDGRGSALAAEHAPPPGELEPYFEVLAARRISAVVARDWGLALVGAVAVAFVSAGVAIIAGVVFVAAALPGSIDFGRGAALGLGAFPSMFGPSTTVTIGHGDYFLAVRIACVALPWVLYPVAATTMTLRFVWPRLMDDRRRLVAFPAKLAILATGVVAVFVAVLPSPAPSGREVDGFTVRTSTAGAAFGAFATVLATASYIVYRRIRLARSSRVPNPAVASLRSALVYGLWATVGLAIVGSMIALPAGVGGADSTRERVGVGVAAAVFGVNVGVDAAVLSVGGVVHVVRAGEPDSTPDLDVWHFSAPPTGERNTKPARYLLVLAPLAAMAAATRLYLRRVRHATRSFVLVGLFTLASVFALSFGALATLARVSVAGYSVAPNRTGALLVDADVASAMLGSLVVGVCVAAVAALFAAFRPRRGPGVETE